MNKLLRGFFTASAAVFLCSGCKGIPPENEAMSKALQDRDVTYSIVALDDKCFYLSLENQDLIFDYLMETDKNKEGGSYYTMEITTKKTDAMSFQWVQAAAYQNNTLKKIKNGDCDVMMMMPSMPLILRKFAQELPCRRQGPMRQKYESGWLHMALHRRIPSPTGAAT